MERLSFHIAKQLSQGGDLTLVRMGYGNWFLPLFLAWATLRLLFALLTRRVDVVLLGDPVLSGLGWLAKRFRVPVAVVVHGLDITYPAVVYQRYLDWMFWNRFDACIGISRHVREIVRQRLGTGGCCHLIHPGVDLSPDPPPVVDGHGQSPRLLILGRLVPRKGALWLVEHVLPALVPALPTLQLDIVGDGPDHERIAGAIAALGLQAHVSLHGAVDDASKAALLAEAHLVLIPNQPVADDPEGFGLVALEAAAAARYVLAADLEGLRDAVHEPDTGLLLPAGDADRWIHAVLQACSDLPGLIDKGRHARASIGTEHSWQRMGERYRQVLDGLA